MKLERSKAEHSIWVSAFLKGLTEATIDEAECMAINAVRVYQARWNSDGAEDQFDATSLIARHKGPYAGEEPYATT